MATRHKRTRRWLPDDQVLYEGKPVFWETGGAVLAADIPSGALIEVREDATGRILAHRSNSQKNKESMN